MDKRIGKRRKIDELYKDGMSQNWAQNSYQQNWSDQFGFVITYGSCHTLFYKKKEVYSFHSLDAAKVVSRVILNDIIMNKKYKS